MPPSRRLQHGERIAADTHRRTLTPTERLVFDLPPQVVVRDFWFELDVGDGWRAAYRLVPWLGQAVIAELRVFPADVYPGRDPGAWRADVLGVKASSTAPSKVLPGARVVECRPVQQGLTRRFLRTSVPIGLPARVAAAFLAELAARVPRLAELGFTSRPVSLVRRRKGGRSNRFYAQIARDYVRRLAAGSRRPIADVAARRKLRTTVIRDAIHDARDRGLLTPGRQGVPGGQLTPQVATLLSPRRRPEQRSRKARKESR